MPKEKRADGSGLRWLGRGLAVALLGVAIWYARHPGDIQLPQTVVLYGFTAMSDVLQEAVLPEFQKQWQATSGRRVEFISTFAGSGAITRDIIDRIPVELAILSSGIDASRLARRGITYSHQYRVLTRSPIVILVRAGNPKGIGSFRDLLQDGVQLIQCDPLTSGAGEWSLLSFHAAARRWTGSHESALELQDELQSHVLVTVPSARAAMVALADESDADALITYESEWLGLDGDRRGLLQVVYPETTLMSEHLVLRLDKNIGPDKGDLIDALVEYLRSQEAQAMFEDYGFTRSDLEIAASDRFAEVLTLDDLGGPAEAERRILTPWLQRSMGPAAIHE